MADTIKFFDLFENQRPALAVKFSNESDEQPLIVNVKSSLGPPANKGDLKYINSICQSEQLSEFATFYARHCGLTLFSPYHPFNVSQTPLLTFLEAREIPEFTERYLPGGDNGWVIDYNKSKAIYRGNDRWIAFAEIDDGPAFLAIFLEGENAGCIFYVTPQPHFNILKPIAKSFELLLERIGKDPAAFLRLVRAYTTVKRDDGQNYGFNAVAYIPEFEGENIPPNEEQPFWKRIFR
jgi:hypothetical protein